MNPNFDVKSVSSHENIVEGRGAINLGPKMVPNSPAGASQVFHSFFLKSSLVPRRLSLVVLRFSLVFRRLSLV